MTEPTLVTIGIPFLNARRTLRDAVRSVFAQTHCAWELLLVDDGSSDDSLELVRHLQDNRVRIISDGVNRGLVARLNQIAAMARGPLLARMDADDLMHPHRLERQVKFLGEHPHVDVLDSATFTVDDDLTPVGVRGLSPLVCDPKAVLRRGLLIHPAVTGRTEWFRANPYDPAYVRAEDRELWCRTCAGTTFARLVEPLFFYRESLRGNLPNYLRSAKTVRRILRVYGPGIVGRLRTELMVGQSHAKDLVYRTCATLGMLKLLIRRRNRALDPPEWRSARDALAAVLSTPLPGLETRRREKELQHQ